MSFQVVGQRCPTDSQSVIGCCSCPWFSARDWMSVHIGIDTMHFRHRIQRIQAWSELKASSLRVSFHGKQRIHGSFREATSTLSIYGAHETQQESMALYPYGTIASGMPWLTNISTWLKSYSIREKSYLVPETYNLPVLVRSWILEKNLQLPPN